MHKSRMSCCDDFLIPRPALVDKVAALQEFNNLVHASVAPVAPVQTPLLR